MRRDQPGKHDKHGYRHERAHSAVIRDARHIAGSKVVAEREPRQEGEGAADCQKAAAHIHRVPQERHRERAQKSPNPPESGQQWEHEAPPAHGDEVPRRGGEPQKPQNGELAAVHQAQRKLEAKAQCEEGEDAVEVETPSPIGAFGEKPRHEDEQRHVEQVNDVECEAQDGVVVMDWVHEVSRDHQHDEDALDVVEQRDSLMGGRVPRARCCHGYTPSLAYRYRGDYYNGS